MKLRKKALFPAIAMVLAAVIALSGVTYAWFTTGNTANVNGLDVNVQTANGIQISLDAQSWRSTITAKDITDEITSSLWTDRCIQYPTAGDGILPVSSAGVVSNGKLVMYNGAYNEEDGKLKSTATAEATGNTGNYVAFDLFFKSSMPQQMSLILGGADDQSYVRTSDAFGGADVGTEKAVRVAFVHLGSTTADDVDGARALANGSSALIWEPNAYSHVSGAKGIGATDKQETYGFNAEFNGVAEEALNSTMVKDKLVVDSTTEGAVAAVAKTTTYTQNAEFTKVFQLAEGITKIRVYIWLEGQDVDCINDISFGDFVTQLVFAVDKAGTTTQG